MPHRVVDRFEAVEVEEEQREALVLAARQRDGLLEALVERETIGQLGQPVAVRRVEQLALRALELGDVDRDADRADDVVVAVGERLDVMAQPVIAVRALDADVPAGEHVADDVFRDQRRARLADEVLAAQFDLDERAAGDRAEAAVAADRPQDRVDVVGDQLQAVRVLVQLRLGDRLRADVFERDQGLVGGRQDPDLDPGLERGEGVNPLDRNTAAPGGADVGDELRGEWVDELVELEADHLVGGAVEQPLRFVVDVRHAEVRVDDVDPLADRLEQVVAALDRVGGDHARSLHHGPAADPPACREERRDGGKRECGAREEDRVHARPR